VTIANINFTEDQIVEAIGSAKSDIDQYVELMEMFLQRNVADDRDFQKKFNGYYILRQRSAKWYQIYYEYMESRKKQNVSFSDTLIYLRERLNRYEPSFSSKLVATHDHNLPIWDKYVLQSLGVNAPSYTSKTKFEKAIAIYKSIVEWYAEFVKSKEGAMIVSIFDNVYGTKKSISNTKKIDFALWKIRSSKS
jgi:hypothetical protein